MRKSSNKNAKYTRGAKLFIGMVVAGLGGSIYALAKVMMEGL